MLTQVAKVLQQAANFTSKGFESDSIQSETAELLTRLSSRPENYKASPNNPVTSMKQLKRNPNRHVDFTVFYW